MLLYEIANDVHWLMLTDVKHIKKSVLCAQSSFVRSLMPPMSKQRFKLIHLVDILKKRLLRCYKCLATY